MLSQRTLNNFNDTEYALNVVGLIAQVRYVIKYQSSAPCVVCSGEHTLKSSRAKRSTWRKQKK